MSRNTWKDYEHYIFQHFKNVYPDANISFNVERYGLISKTKRQIDILIEERVIGYTLSIVIDCKFFNKKVDVKVVESFIGFLHDVKANKGILITNNGFTKAAKIRAENDNFDVSLEIIELNQLHEFQGFGGIAFRENAGIIFRQPRGWITDFKPRHYHVLATLYPMGLTFEEALELEEYIHIHITNKTEKHANIESLFDFQEIYMKDRSEKCEISYHNKNIRSDVNSILRIARYPEHDIVDFTWFLDFYNCYFYCTLLSVINPPESQIKKRLKRLEIIMREAYPIDVEILGEEEGARKL